MALGKGGKVPARGACEVRPDPECLLALAGRLQKRRERLGGGGGRAGEAIGSHVRYGASGRKVA